MTKLTEEQKRVFDFIVACRRTSGAPPTVREIAAHFGYRSPNSARQHLRLIEQKGYIRRLPGRARGIEVLVRRRAGGRGYAKSRRAGRERVVNVPIVGTVAAGTAVTAVENIEDTIALDRGLFSGGDFFSLYVKGDSMKGAGILDGDIAIVRRQASVDDGEIAAVIIDGEATLKRFKRRKRSVVLKAENPAYRDMVLGSERDIQIAGKLAGIIRKC